MICRLSLAPFYFESDNIDQIYLHYLHLYHFHSPRQISRHRDEVDPAPYYFFEPPEDHSTSFCRTRSGDYTVAQYLAIWHSFHVKQEEDAASR